jgi:hypothetical protein
MSLIDSIDFLLVDVWYLFYDLSLLPVTERHDTTWWLASSLLLLFSKAAENSLDFFLGRTPREPEGTLVSRIAVSRFQARSRKKLKIIRYFFGFYYWPLLTTLTRKTPRSTHITFLLVYDVRNNYYYFMKILFYFFLKHAPNFQNFGFFFNRFDPHRNSSWSESERALIRWFFMIVIGRSIDQNRLSKYNECTKKKRIN